jgi:SagB-type dehydrogenase family enzyme
MPKSLYKDRETIELPPPNPQLTKLTLFDVISKRRSVRNFSNEPITLEELSTILFYSSGMTGEYSETKGIYYYDPIRHFLKVIKKGFKSNDFKKVTISFNLSEQAAFVIYILGNMRLTGYKYGDRGYRFMLLEAGHLAQNLYLTSTAIGAGAVASGGFLDVEILEILDLDDTDMLVLYEIVIGNPNMDTDCRFLP